MEILKSTRTNKKYMVTIDGKTYHFLRIYLVIKCITYDSH